MPSTIIRFVLSTFACCLVVAQTLQNVKAQAYLDFDKGKVFDEVSEIVKEHFYAKNFDATSWDQRAAEFRKLAIDSKTLDRYDSMMNSLLATLKTSHTYYYSRLNPKRFQLLGVFNRLYDQDRADLFVYEGIGVDTKMIDGKTYVSAVYDGMPAAEAGLRFGDQIVSVDDQPFHRFLSFKRKTGTDVKIDIIRGGKKRSLTIKVRRLDGRTMFENALKSSIKIIERKGKKIGYLHAWSYAGSKYQEEIRSAILWGKLSQCDALVFDIRDGWGGADINYLNLFRKPIAIVKSTPRHGPVGSYSGVWEKPVVLLTNGGSTSGKELFAYGFKKLGLGKLIGEKTAGAVVAGRIFLLSNGDVLYLAVNDVKVDGVRLEGQGVSPDILVPRSFLENSGNDPQLEKAVSFLTR